MKTKNIFTKSAVVFLALCVMLSGMTFTAFADELVGSGTQDNPYVITTAQQLADLSTLDEVGYVSLGDDIDMSEIPAQACYIKNLTGAFAGNGHKISNLSLVGQSGNYSTKAPTGLIGTLGGSVNDLILDGVTVSYIQANNDVGTIVGNVTEGATVTVDNCIVSGEINCTKSSSVYLGGIIGAAIGVTEDTSVTVNNCVSNVKVAATSSNYAGGVIGAAQYKTTLTVNKCAILGDVGSSSCQAAGGVAGYFMSTKKVAVTDSYYGGTVSGKTKCAIGYEGTRSTSALKDVTCENFCCDSDKNYNSSWSGKEPITAFKVTTVSGFEGKSTDELKAIETDGFEVRDGEFDNYPVPVWSPSEPPAPPVETFECTVEFKNTKDGTLTLTGDEDGSEITGENGVYTLTEKGIYNYTLAGMENYEDVSDSFELVGIDNGESKTIWLHPVSKSEDPEGEGTQENPFVITNEKQLVALSKLVADGKNADAYAVLDADIVVNDSFLPLGATAVMPFKGNFDGQGHSVTITVDEPNLLYFGFFGCLDGATVKNLTVNGEIYCSEPSRYVGGIAARARGNVTIENCINNATVSASADNGAHIGGIVGGYDDGVEYVSENIRLIMTGCTNNGLINVSGAHDKTFVGGVVGGNENCVQLTGCASNGDIYAPYAAAGGLLGQAGYRTGDYAPSITDCTVDAAIVGAEGKVGRLWSNGVVADANISNSGDNTYTEKPLNSTLLAEANKYSDIVAFASDAQVGDVISPIKSGETISGNVIVIRGELDKNQGYTECDGGKLKLAKLNESGKTVEETATLKITDEDGGIIRKPIKIKIYPSGDAVRTTLMDRIASTYAGKSGEWVVFDMAAYEKLGFGKNTTYKSNYLNLTTNALAGNSAFVTDRAKAEIILPLLGVDSTKLTPYGGGEQYDNAALLGAMDFGTSHYTAPWILLAEEAGQLKLTDEQRSTMIKLLADNQGDNGLFYYTWLDQKYDDADTTGTAMAALARFYETDSDVKNLIDKAVAGLAEVQGADGSFGNINTDAMVIMGLAAAGINPSTDKRFIKNGISLGSAVLNYVNDGNNGFIYSYDTGDSGAKANALATEQGFRALIVLEQLKKCDSFNVYTLESKGGAAEPVDKTVTAFEANAKGEEDTDDTDDSGSGGTSQSETISVPFTVSVPDGEWLSVTVSAKKNATVASVIKKAFAIADITAVGVDKGYISAVTKDGKTLSQLDMGPNSGWMYKVNGKIPDVGIDSYKLSDGDKLELFYTKDYTKEYGTDGWHGSGSSRSNSTSGTTVTVDPTVIPGGEQSVNPFADVKDGDWFAAYVAQMYSKKLMLGVSDNEFAPNDNLTRAMFVTILYRAAGSPAAAKSNFADIADGEWYAAAVAWAQANGIVNGETDTLFAPDGTITREQVAAIMFRYATYGGADNAADADISTYSDFGSMSEYAADGIRYVIATGIMTGKTDTTFNPLDNMTRAETAAVIARMLSK